MANAVYKVAFFGSGAIGIPSFKGLQEDSRFRLCAVVTQPDRPAGRGLSLSCSPIKSTALRFDLPLLQPEGLRGTGGDLAFETLKDLETDFFVVFAYGQILPKRFLDLPRIACVNLHASLLPKHRGAAPIHSAILAGDREAGVTLVHMTPELDAGDIISASRIPVRRRETSGELHDRLAELSKPLLLEGLADLAEGRAKRRPQDVSLATYAPKLDRSSGRIDWREDAAAIDRLIRAMNPWPGAWTVAPSAKGEVRIKVHAALRILSSGKTATAQPGEILGWDRRGIRVAAGRGVVVLREVQQEGRKRMAADAFAAGWGGAGPRAFLVDAD